MDLFSQSSLICVPCFLFRRDHWAGLWKGNQSRNWQCGEAARGTWHWCSCTWRTWGGCLTFCSCTYCVTRVLASDGNDICNFHFCFLRWQSALSRHYLVGVQMCKLKTPYADVYFLCLLQRNDMVEYFGKQLEGFCFSSNGWVQSYDSWCVKPPIIFGDVSRPKAKTVFWSQYAQSVTTCPMKGMLTGPVTILNWSFVRNELVWRTPLRFVTLFIMHTIWRLEEHL